MIEQKYNMEREYTDTRDTLMPICNTNQMYSLTHTHTHTNTLNRHREETDTRRHEKLTLQRYTTRKLHRKHTRICRL